MPQSRLPPHNEEAEQSILGALLIDKDAIIAVAEFLRPEHFYKDAHGKIYQAMISLYEEREPIDLITLVGKLKKQGDYKMSGGNEYLTELVDRVPTSTNVEYYARIVEEHS
ncbi:MAG: replicative DNA helicase, partial [Nitrosopumilus sp. CG10_big_fil_rev_8_21_14_0_10_33_7]